MVTEPFTHYLGAPVYVDENAKRRVFESGWYDPYKVCAFLTLEDAVDLEWLILWVEAGCCPDLDPGIRAGPWRFRA